MESVHEPVLLHEIVAAFAALEPRSSSRLVYLDGTLGGGGHLKAVAEAFGGKLTVIGLDRDPEAVKRASGSLQGIAEKAIFENIDYRDLDQALAKHVIDGIDLFLLDLGISSDELDRSGRGFSFQKDETLLMTMGDPEGYPFTARTIVNEWDEAVIANILFGYAQERFSRRIARAIISYRSKKPIETTMELAEIVKSSVPPFYRRGRIHPATKTFQALRIAVNDELNALREGISKGYDALRENGRMAIISFHSLEDRIVKEFFKKKASEGATILTKKPMTATEEEVAANPRSRSAKLRILQKSILQKNITKGSNKKTKAQ